MSLIKQYDVFIAYHGSYAGERGSRGYADTVYNYLNEKGLNCFYFPYSQKDVYKANIIEVMRSHTFLLVCTRDLGINGEGKIDPKIHYELSTEIDAFYALSQLGEVNVRDAKVLVCGEYYKGNEAHLHTLFENRIHFYSEGNILSDTLLENIYSWVKERTAGRRTWQEKQTTNEINEVFATRAAMNQSCSLDNIVATAKSIRVAGISNTEMTARINPNAIANCIKNGGTIEFLFLDPNGKYTELREQEENLRKDRIKNITALNIEEALDIREKSGGSEENFKIYIYDKLPRMNMIFADDYLVLQYYANKIPGIENPSFFIEKQRESPIFTFCEKAYEYLKSEAKEFDNKL